ncbi:hypothetical protein [Streptomyces sp. NPDC002133]|uniref:hypothetical protein n=1 Tax=Streptomyces sp. NPDC002133 TaxID=3154409 RepID=UPI00332C6D52
MRRLTNLGWSDVPYGATDHLVQSKKRLLTGIALLWADAGGTPVLMGAGAVLVNVHRTKTVQLSPGPLNLGYIAWLAEREEDTESILKVLDVFLVQTRRDAHALAWHNAADDLHVMKTLRPNSAGVTGITEAWKSRRTPDTGIARCVDTAIDMPSNGLLADTADAHWLPLGHALLPHQEQGHVQQRYRDLAEAAGDPKTIDGVTQSVAAGALAQAYTVALLGGRHLGLLDWEEPPPAFASLERVAWDELPNLFRTTPAA